MVSEACCDLDDENFQLVWVAIALGNNTIAQTLSYIDEVAYDQQLQTQFDQATARESALSIFLDIGCE